MEHDETRWTAETERMVAERLGTLEQIWQTAGDDARAILGVLAAAGLLVSPQMLAVLEAAKAWRQRSAGSILGDHERPLAAAVDALVQQNGEAP
jgi:hypothetical protein